MHESTSDVFRPAHRSTVLRPMRSAGRRYSFALIVCALLAAGCSEPDPGSDIEVLRRHESEWSAMLEAEDLRGTGPDGITPLLDALRADAPVLRRIGVRALGRLEADSLASRIARLLADPDASVRAEAANALAQVAGATTAIEARATLRGRLTAEPDRAVKGALAEALGRVPHGDSAAVVSTIDLLGGLVTANAPADSLRLGIARGLYFLVRQPASRSNVPDGGIAALRRLTVRTDADSLNETLASHIRTVAVAALVATARVGAADLRAILQDPDPYVRREAVAGLPGLVSGDTAAALARDALGDPSPVVRYEALRVNARFTNGSTCDAALAATADPDTHVAVLAIDRLATGCGGDPAILLLDSIAGTLPSADTRNSEGWHRPAQAIVALAGLDPLRARPHVQALEQSPDPFVRMRAARAATLTLSGATLHRLSSDSVANVRTEAVNGLARVEAHVADAVYVAQLREWDDSQLLQAAAAALAGSTDPDAATALLAALERLTSRERETERDARVAIVSRIGELGDSSLATPLSRFADDYDPRIANAAADIVERWTGERPPVSIRPAPSLARPSLEDIAGLADATVTIEMENGSRIRLRLLALEAPMNAWRFARLAREGYYDGLTFHRIAPNFVIQGGSPNANEYSGDGSFSRDEVGRPANWRGTVGLSTRGRDTGDGQLYINLIDNVRLDHQYTVFGEVLSDGDAVRAILEGDRIRRIRVD